MTNTHSLHLAFVCWGNTCRSPFAEHFAKQYYGNERYHFSSLGLRAEQGRKASNNGIIAAQSWQIDLSAHTAQPIANNDEVALIDYWVCMTNEIKQVLINEYGISPPKTILLDEQGVADPFGGTLLVYEQCYQIIAQAIKKLPILQP
jgi:protein-tyrosine-phosphatase